jgi:hypothetical protein
LRRPLEGRSVSEVGSTCSGEGGFLTLEADVLGQEESRVLPGNGVLGVAAARLEHLVESRYAIAFFEFDNIVADFVHDARDVVALVGVLGGLNPL